VPPFRFLWGHTFLVFFPKILQSVIAESCDRRESVCFARKCQTFSKWPHCFAYLASVNENSCFSTSSLAIGSQFVDFCHSNRCVIDVIVLICILIMTCDMQHLLYTYLPFVYHIQ
jgi:hypothetical protein